MRDQKEYQREYYEKNRDMCKAKAKAYYEKNKEKCQEYMRSYARKRYLAHKLRALK